MPHHTGVFENILQILVAADHYAIGDFLLRVMNGLIAAAHFTAFGNADRERGLAPLRASGFP